MRGSGLRLLDRCRSAARGRGRGHLREPPTLLIGTVDKFAMMPWNREVAAVCSGSTTPSSSRLRSDHPGRAAPDLRAAGLDGRALRDGHRRIHDAVLDRNSRVPQRSSRRQPRSPAPRNRFMPSTARVGPVSAAGAGRRRVLLRARRARIPPGAPTSACSPRRCLRT